MALFRRSRGNPWRSLMWLAARCAAASEQKPRRVAHEPYLRSPDASFFDGAGLDLEGSRSADASFFDPPATWVMSPSAFEHHCADILRQQGWAAQTTRASGDQGIDVLAERAGVRIVIQCKYYSKPVGNAAVQEAFAALAHARAQIAAVVTNSRYTRSALQLGRDTGVYLLHVSDLRNADKFFGRSQKYDHSEGKAICECPRCRVRLRLPAGRSGQVRCPNCGGSFHASTK